MSTTQDHPHIEKLPLEVDGITVRETIREIFRDPENGTPDNISKAGCLALALKSNEVGGVGKGYVCWNAWRRAFPVPYSSVVNHTNFQESEFNEEMDFRLFEFGYAANFKKTIFRKKANFDHAKFGISTDFSFSFWADETSFKWTQWGDGIRFSYSYWCKHAWFIGSQWGSVGFNFSTWKGAAIFTGAGWSDYVDFSGCKFHSLSIEGAEWHYLNTRFYDFENLFEQVKNFAKRIGSDPTTFELIIFSGSISLGEINFSNRKFKKATLFNELESTGDICRDETGLPLKDPTGNFYHFSELNYRHPVVFQLPPKFHGCELHQDTSFEGAEFPKATGTEEAARAYRTLKLAFNKQQAVREEQRFFKLETEEEATDHLKKATSAFKTFRITLGLNEFTRWLLYRSYAVFSDYGFSALRPLLLWVISLIFFAYAFGALKGLPICIGFNSCEFQSEWLKTSLLQSLPLSGLEKLEQLEVKTLALAVALVIHKAVSLLCFVLTGLALRNLFKLK